MPTLDDLGTAAEVAARNRRRASASPLDNILEALSAYTPGIAAARSFGLPAQAIRGMDQGMQPLFEEAGKLQHYGEPYFNAGPSTQAALGATVAPAIGPAEATMGTLGAGLIRRMPLVEGQPVGLGAFNTTTPRTILGATKKGGYSVSLPTGEKPTEGFMSGIFRNDDPRNLVIEGRTPTLKDIGAFTETNLKALQNPERHLGTWFDPESGNTYFDVSQRFNPDELRQATKFGERTAQKSIYDVGAGTTRPVGNWEEFIKSPEFHERMNLMADRGQEYLSRFPSKEWWDMHGSSFERIYGPQNMAQTAGFTASTAPNTKPIENLQHMSEYMRRYIRGEPVVQPDFRVPAGQMSLAEGRQMPLEQSRVANLEKSARGDIEALSRRKVQSEARAMMGDPQAVVLDRHWARLGEAPERGIFTGPEEGVISSQPRKTKSSPYEIMEGEVVNAANARNRDPRDFSADAWTGIRDTIQKTSELFGTKFKGSAITGESKSYADHLDDLVARKAAHLRMTPQELEKRLRGGDASLLGIMLGAPTIGAAYRYWDAGQNAPASSADNRASVPAL